MSNDTQVAAPTALPDWERPLVQAAYKILCSDDKPPAGEHWEGFVARRFVAAVEASARQLSEQPGFVMVPVDPTEAMLEAANNEETWDDDAMHAETYRSMIAAAPTEAKPAPYHCQSCNGYGMIGGPSFYAPDEGGVPCPDCATPDEQIEAAAKVIAERMDSPWEHMYEQGRNNMRNIARAAMIAARPLTASPTAPSTEASGLVRDERAEFEAWYFDKYMLQPAKFGDRYDCQIANQQWIAWQARALKGTK